MSSPGVDDEFDAYDFSEFTAADLALVDVVAAREHVSRRTPAHAFEDYEVQRTAPFGGPQIAIELEPAADDGVVKIGGSGNSDSGSGGGSKGDKGQGSTPKKDTERSPLERYRQRKILTVSDLVGPAWCEVQFDYGLRQGRSRKLADRPASFVSGKGKVITVETEVAAANDKVIQRGQMVHKVLERELKPETFPVTVRTDEERWALRLVNMLSCLDSLMELGICREMPVFGVVHGVVISGIIDEIGRDPLPAEASSPVKTKKRAPSSVPGTPQKTKRSRAPSSTESQPLLTSFFPSPSKRGLTPPLMSSPPSRTHTLHILDTKTRRSQSLPSDDDALSSRLQVMLYHQLLSALLSPTFPFAALWARLSLDPFRKFSDNFLIEAGIVQDIQEKGTFMHPATLDDLVAEWRFEVNALNIDGVSPNLSLVYRSQSPEKPQKLPRVTTEMRAAQQEARDLARAIEASLRDPEFDIERALLERSMKGQSDVDTSEHTTLGGDAHLAWLAQDGMLERVEPSVLETILEGAKPDEGETESLEPSIPNLPTVSSEATDFQIPEEKESSPEPSLPLVYEVTESQILGRKEFRVDDKLLNTHLKNILLWWHGKRAPQGVEPKHAKRCFSCEYREGCEWREKKAREAATKHNATGPPLL
ncbi:hypothetical protein FA95DRAFT_1674468 [Auriscalpium vulgare]|uniref:Uncharacterized protein n=1 Tax=Auriscalpium vulgare TaxID=40419 RepID=A0ACB8SBX0_9AGAM|nr:hypothetical protein FA95DRAFT_1674468 [Auriscalpium vulgare]